MLKQVGLGGPFIGAWNLFGIWNLVLGYCSLADDHGQELGTPKDAKETVSFEPEPALEEA